MGSEKRFASALFYKVGVSAFTFSFPLILMKMGFGVESAVKTVSIISILPSLVSIGFGLEFFSKRYKYTEFYFIPVLPSIFLLLLSMCLIEPFSSMVLMSIIISFFSLRSDFLRSQADISFSLVNIVGYAVAFCPLYLVFLLPGARSYSSAALILICVGIILFSISRTTFRGVGKLLKYFREHFRPIFYNVMGISLFWMLTLGDRLLLSSFFQNYSDPVYDFFMTVTISNLLMFSLPIFVSMDPEKKLREILPVVLVMAVVSFTCSFIYHLILVYAGFIEEIAGFFNKSFAFNLLLTCLVFVRVLMLKLNFYSLSGYRIALLCIVGGGMFSSAVLSASLASYFMLYAGFSIVSIFFILVLAQSNIDEKII